jgi:hypothetical protein
MEAASGIHGYTYGSPELERSPVSAEDLDLLEQTVLFGEEDARHLRAAGEILRDQVEDVLDVWYGFVASHPHLVHYFARPDGEPDGDYLASVRGRFGQWIRDLCERPCSRPGTRPSGLSSRAFPVPTRRTPSCYCSI